MVERGFSKFSAREAARRSGYTVGSIYNVFGSLDAYILAINTVTLTSFADWMHKVMAKCSFGEDRIRCLVEGYFGFAEANTNAWMALYDHRRPEQVVLEDADITERVKLTAIIDREVAAALGRDVDGESRRLARSLIAIVHGHCVLALTGNFALMNERDPLALAVARVKESIEMGRVASAG